jgi:uncharacterized protein YqfB (UPF0267 family)
MDNHCLQRIAILETKQTRLIELIEEHEEREESSLKKNQKMLQDILSEQAKMRNFWGGVVFTVTAFGSGAVLAFNVFFKE